VALTTAVAVRFPVKTIEVALAAMDALLSNEVMLLATRDDEIIADAELTAELRED
jgi:hypothetical protein